MLVVSTRYVLPHLWLTLERFPPVAVRLFARTPGYGPRALTDDEIAEASGLTPQRVSIINRLVSWDTVPVGDMRAFMRGCQLDVADAKQIRRISQYVQKNLVGKFAYLRRSPHWHSKYVELKSIWLNHLSQMKENKTHHERRAGRKNE